MFLCCLRACSLACHVHACYAAIQFAHTLQLTMTNIAGSWGMTKEEAWCVTVDGERERQLMALGPQETYGGVERKRLIDQH